jgi:cytochrome P450
MSSNCPSPTGASQVHEVATETERAPVRLETMQDCTEALRSDKLIPEEFLPEAPFRDGTIIKLHGEEHLKRRRILNRLVRREAHTRWREVVLVPTMHAELAAMRSAPDEEGVVRLDLVPFAMRFFNVMACAMTGLDVSTAEDRDLLLSLIDPLNLGDALRFEDDVAARRAEGLAALTVFRDRFYEPSLRRRRDLLARVDSGELKIEDLSLDMMLLVALRADPAWDDEGNALRNVMQFMLGASHTNVHPLGFAIDHLERWFEAHPEDYVRRTDPAFLESAVNEALRLHTIGPTLGRIAIADLTLSSGRKIEVGQRVEIGIQSASVDITVYGEDASSFNPYRTATPGAYPYGLAFGSGAHMCQGMPIVIGVEGIDGALVYVLKALYEAGARRDTSRPTRSQQLHGYRNSYLSYPLILDPTFPDPGAARQRERSAATEPAPGR